MFSRNTFTITKTLAIAVHILVLAIASQTIHANHSPDHNEQLSETTPQGTALPDELIQKLNIDAGFGWGIFNGTIYNGNSDYFITQLTISMTPIHDDHHMEMHANMSHETKQHQIDLNLPPLSKGALSMALTGDDTHVHDFEWEVIEVIGFKTNQ